MQIVVTPTTVHCSYTNEQNSNKLHICFQMVPYVKYGNTELKSLGFSGENIYVISRF